MRYYLDKIWHLFLAIAFISMQSASVHIHLDSSHKHHGHDHYHSQLVHAHNIASHHVDAFEPAYQTHSSQVVEFCQEWIVKYGKCFKDLSSAAFLVSSFTFREQTTAIQSYYDNPFFYHSFHFHSQVQARAPPRLFSSYV